MSVTLTPVAGASTVMGNKRIRVYDLAFGGTYATGGETVTASSLGLRKIHWVTPMNPITIGTTLANGGTLPVFTISASGTSVAIAQLEDAAGTVGLPIGQEKTNAEAYVANATLRCVFIGY